MTEVSVSNSSLEQFISFFNYSLITVSVQPETENAHVPYSKHFGGKTRVRAFTVDKFFSSTIQSELQHAQANGCAVYFMVNEGDGVPKGDDPNDLNCGRRANVRTLRSLFIDTDSGDSKALLAELTKISLIPHILVQTSPDKYHFYFLLEPVPAEGENIDQWIALQHYLDDLVPNLDQNMVNINRVLRLPGFFNHKYNPACPVQLIKHVNIKPYNLIDLFNRLGAYVHLSNGNHGTGYVNGANGSYNPFEFPKTKVKEGGRRKAITSYIERLLENVLPLSAKDEDYFTSINGFIHDNIEEPHLFLPGGSRRQNIEQYFHDQRERRIRLRYEEETARAIKKFDHQEAVERNKLPDEFYLHFPGDLGFLTREIHQFAPHISLELCFAGALCISGAMKAESFRYSGHWPMVNGIIVAGPGAGKSTLQRVIEKILGHAGLLGRYPRLLDFAKTAQMLHLNLYAAGGVATTIVDEAGDYLVGMKHKNSHQGTLELKTYYKKAATSDTEGSRLTPGGAVASNYPPIVGGFLSVWLLVQPEKFKTSLSMEDMTDGFLPRFLVFRGESKFCFGEMTRGEGRNRRMEPSVNLKVWLEMYGQMLQGPTEEALTPILEQVRDQVRAQHGRGNPSGAIREAQREVVYRLRSEARLLTCPKVDVRLSEEAGAAFDAYMLELSDRANGILADGDSDPRLIVLQRAEEMLDRLICNACDEKGVVDLSLIEAVIEFHRFQTERFFSGELEDMGKDREMETVVTGVIRAVKKKKEAVTASEVLKAITVGCRPRNLESVLLSAVNRGLIWSKPREHKRSKGKKITVYWPAESEDSVLDA